MLASIASIAAKPIMLARPLSISASGLKGPNASRLVLRKAGTRDAAIRRVNRATTPAGSSAACLRTLSPEEEDTYLS